MIDPLAEAKLFQNKVFCIVTIRWNDYSYRFADGLTGRILEQTLSAAIPRFDNAVEVLNYNRILCRFDDRCEQPLCFLGSSTFSNLAKHQNNSNHCSTLVLDWRAAIVNGNLCSVSSN